MNNPNYTVIEVELTDSKPLQFQYFLKGEDFAFQNITGANLREALVTWYKLQYGEPAQTGMVEE